jgi:hypothetical protein
MKVLVACEFSQIVCQSFRKRGHDAYSCDLLPTEGNSEWHIRDDVLKHLDDGWDLMIAHPPCTYLANSGVRWLVDNTQRQSDMVKGAEFFNALLNANILKIAVENPIQHKYARELIRKPDQIIQPWWFGHGETKATCLWLFGLPKLIATNIVEGRLARVHLEKPSPERWKNRSRTYQGIADAMSIQYG